jgi:hypothetical protein
MKEMTLETFTPHVGSSFSATTDGGSLDLVLEEAVGSAGDEQPGGDREPFHLMFRGPARPILPQRIYRLDHGGLGSLEIFIVPIGADDRGVVYQAVFA